MKNKQENNRAILALLSTLIEEFPNQRFGQILSNYGFVKNEHIGPDTLDCHVWRDEFYLESDELLKRVTKDFEELIRK